MRHQIRTRAKAVSLAVAISAALVVSLGGCATSAPSPATGSPDTTIPASKSCAEVGDALTVSSNAVDGRHRGLVTQEEYVRQLDESAALLKAIVAEPNSDIANALDGLIAYIDQAAPAADGGSYDIETQGFNAPSGDLVSACIAAGSDVVIQAKYGG